MFENHVFVLHEKWRAWFFNNVLFFTALQCAQLLKKRSKIFLHNRSHMQKSYQCRQKAYLKQNMAAWLLLTFFICLHNQLSSIHSLSGIKEYKCLKNVIHQIDSKNEWLLLSVTFTAKFELVFVLTLENAFS